METAEAPIKGGIPTTQPSGLPAYVIYKNKHGVEIKVANFDNPDVCPNSGIVEFEAIKKKDFDTFRDTKFSCPLTRDAKTGIFYGILNGFYDNGDPRWVHFPLGVSNIYDRSIPTEAKRACILSKSILVEGSSNAIPRMVKFRLVDKEKVAHQKIKKINDAKRALGLAEGLHGEDLVNMGRNLGINVDNISVTMLMSEVMGRAQDNPLEFLQIIEHPDRDIITVLNRAVDTKVVENEIGKGYTYGGSPIGHNFDFAVDFLRKNRDIMSVIDMKSRGAVAGGEKAMAKEVPQTKESPEVEALRKQLAESQAKIDALTKAPSLTEGSSTYTTIYNPLEQELADLLVKAKAKKLRGLHMYKANETSIAKLKQAIADKK